METESFSFMWPCIITNFFIIKPTRCTNFTNLFWDENLHVSDSSSVHHQEYTQRWYMSYRFVDSFRAGTGWNFHGLPSWPCSKAVYKPVWHIALLSVQWINSWWWTDELSETCRVSWQNKFGKFNWFYYRGNWEYLAIKYFLFIQVLSIISDF